MSLEHRRVESIFEIIQNLVASGQETFRPGHVCDVLREQNSPVGTWQVRADFSVLEAEGRIVCDPATGHWQMAPGAALQQDAG